MNKTYVNILFVLVLIFFSINIYANELENKNRYKMSIMSIGEGASLVDAFGHTAIRVKDEELKNDVVFNFGVYDFNSPNFYSNFVKGRPEYKLGVQNYYNLTQNYIRQKRYIVEHQLNLDQNSIKIIVLTREKGSHEDCSRKTTRLRPTRNLFEIYIKKT